MTRFELYEGRRLERLIGISDAITAVAITLLAVPLIGIGLPGPGEPFDDYLWLKAGPIVAFAFTFLVVFGQWRVHNRMLSDLVGYDSAVFWINAAWLASIAFLPWPSALIGQAWESGQVTGSTEGAVALFYWISLAFVVVMATAMRAYVLRHPGLVDPERWPIWAASRRAVRVRSGILIVGFIACGVAWYFSVIAGVVCMIATLIVLIGASRAARSRMSTEGAPRG
jgi:uncharacterized membrane protein